MKQGLISAFVLMACLIFGGQALFAQAASYGDLKQMTFEVRLDKDHYARWEPIWITFKLSNLSGTTLRGEIPNFLGESQLKVASAGKSHICRSLSAVSGSGGIKIPSNFGPNWSTETSSLLAPSFVDACLQESGEYELQFLIDDPYGVTTLKSNPIKIEISEPTGNNKKAVEFMEAHKNFFGLSAWAPRSKDERSLLEEFVQRYGSTPYGEIATLTLASIYSVENEFEKAKKLLNGLMDSGNTFVASSARRSLHEVNERSRNVQKP